MSGWYGLLDIFELNRSEYRAWADQPPQACPRCGTPLMTDPEDRLRCRFDGWTWDGTLQGKRGAA